MLSETLCQGQGHGSHRLLVGLTAMESALGELTGGPEWCQPRAQGSAPFCESWLRSHLAQAGAWSEWPLPRPWDALFLPHCEEPVTTVLSLSALLLGRGP